MVPRHMLEILMTWSETVGGNGQTHPFGGFSLASTARRLILCSFGPLIGGSNYGVRVGLSSLKELYTVQLTQHSTGTFCFIVRCLLVP
jgi:hypothetical protein